MSETVHNLHILCLHGGDLHGGDTNWKILKEQCSALHIDLETSFRKIHVDAPFITHAGPKVCFMYADWAPFRNQMPCAIRPDESTPRIAPHSGPSTIDERIIASIDQAIQATEVKTTVLVALVLR
ncbi:hypothetical protein N7454_005424 [Penicillium verhagenii]|nr:hypothetical protein N7454_005424 [Penicillium verhagenii]